jgi:hypothetical protein
MLDKGGEKLTKTTFTKRWSNFESMSYSRRQLFILIAVICLAYIITTPPIYRYFVSNQTVHLPIVKNTLNPSYLEADWYVNSANGFDSPRFFYTRLIALLSQVVGLPAAVLLLYILATITTILALWILIHEIFNDALVATITVGITLGLHLVASPLPPPNLGGNSLIGSYLDPDKIANPLVLIGLIYAIRSKYKRSFALFGVATLFHVVNGFWIALATGLTVAVIEAHPKIKSKEYKQSISRIPWDGAIIYGIVASFVIVPLYMSNFGSGISDLAVYIDAWIRHPHHKILSSWNPLVTSFTAGFVLIGSLLLFLLKELLIPNKRSRQFTLIYITSLLSFMFLAGYIFVEVIYIPSVTQLQAFRIDDFVYIILYAVLAKLSIFIMYDVSKRLDVRPSSFCINTCTIIVIMCILVWSSVFIIQTSLTDSGPKIEYIQNPSHGEDLNRSFEWIQSNTPKNSIILTPPSEAGVRLATSRAIVVNWKSFPFRHNAIIEWEHRLSSVCDMPIKESGQSIGPLSKQCRENYHNLSENEVTGISEKYGADYILTKNSTYALEHEISFGEYHIYKIQ